MKWVKWFIAGALAVPLLHQPVLYMFHAMGWIDRAPYSMEPTKPFGVPTVISLSFWGGLWGILLGLVLSRIRKPSAWWATAIVFGAVAPTLVAGFVVAPLKGLPTGGNAKLALVGIAVNGAWALGTAVIAWLATSRNSRA